MNTVNELHERTTISLSKETRKGGPNQILKTNWNPGCRNT